MSHEDTYVDEMIEFDMLDMDEEEEDEDGGGAPDWIVTFADLMTLLMCFFVLLVAFSELDIKRYRMIAGSMREAFGVQQDVRAFDPPKGTSFIMQEFNPGQPTFSPLEDVKQATTHEAEVHDDTESQDEKAQRAKETRDQVDQLSEILGESMDAGLVQIEGFDDRIVIRVQEKGLFGSGNARVGKSFKGLLGEVGEALNEMPGLIMVSGHTDNRPMKSKRYRSNWDLSSSRAASVVHVFREEAGIPGNRLAAIGYGESRPVAPNDTKENRADNRRVEIALVKRGAGEWGQAAELTP
jgi:chemotaxis protein MotB